MTTAPLALERRTAAERHTAAHIANYILEIAGRRPGVGLLDRDIYGQEGPRSS